MFHYHITCRDHGQTEHLLKGCALGKQRPDRDRLCLIK